MKLIYTLLVTAFLTLSLQAQSIKTFQGPYVHGNAKYNYYELPNEGRVYHGAFQFTYDVDPNSSEGLYVNGTYANDLKDGKWTYRLFRYDGSMELQLNYKKGELWGKCTYIEAPNYGKRRQYDVLLKANKVVRVQLTEGEDSDPSFQTTGQCNAEGFADGIWRKGYIADGNLYTRIEEWSNGTLVTRKEKNESTGDIKVVKDPDPRLNIPAELLSDFSFRGLLASLLRGWVAYSKEAFEQLCKALERGEKPFMGVRTKKTPAPTNSSLAISSPRIEPEPDHIYEYLEEMPEFPGGQAAMMEWLSKNINYPPIAAENNIQGRVMVSFVVETDGSLSNVRVVRGVDPNLDREAMRLVSMMPKWKPGMQDGKRARARFTLPVQFSLQ
nr:energy transducer TonB [uncultured Porphyromonas sp.]